MNLFGMRVLSGLGKGLQPQFYLFKPFIHLIGRPFQPEGGNLAPLLEQEVFDKMVAQKPEAEQKKGYRN